jgi:hypothetical protein
MANDLSHDQITAVQAAVDRVSSWQDGATEGTLEDELRTALDEVGVSLDDDQFGKVLTALEEHKGTTDAHAVLGG